MTRWIAERLVAHAAAVIAPLRPDQAQAMTAELAAVDGGNDALTWALGCVAASYRQRARPVTLVMFGGRLAVAGAAALVGIVHLAQAKMHLAVKLHVMRGLTPAGWAEHRAFVERFSLEHWIAYSAALGAIGMLYLLAGGALLAGRLFPIWLAMLGVSGLAFFGLPLLGHSGLTFPAIYVGLIALVAVAGAIMARIERWDIRRA